MIKSLKTTGFSQTIPENSFPKFIDWQMQSHEANNLQSQSPKFLLHQTVVVILKLSGVRQGQYVPMEITPLERYIFFRDNPPVKLNTYLKSTFCHEVKIVSAADSEICTYLPESIGILWYLRIGSRDTKIARSILKTDFGIGRYDFDLYVKMFL